MKTKIKIKQWKLMILFLISIIAGLSLLLYPEDVNHLIIRGVGLIWILEGVNYLLQFTVNRMNELTKNQ